MITLIEGPTGAGKSWLMAWIGYKKWKRGAAVFPNFVVKFSPENQDITRWHNLDELYHLKHGVILIDEAPKLMEARRWASLPLNFAEKIAQHRHDFLDIITCTQSFSHIDIRVRENVHVRYLCQSVMRFPLDETSHPMIQLIRITKKVRQNVADGEQIRWRVASRRFALISRYFTKDLYDTYYNFNTEKYICKLKLNQKEWKLCLYSREMIDRGKARL